MLLVKMLDKPAWYDVKTRLLSLGRASVRDFLRQTVTPREGGRVLDVGCGTGAHGRTFAGRMRYFGVDQNGVYVRHAIARRGEPFAVMDAAKIAFPDGAFDVVFAVGLFHHLSDAQAVAAAREMRRVTKDNGTALVIDAVLPPQWNLLGRCLFRWDRGHHVREQAALTALLAPEGFRLLLENIPRSFPYQRAVWVLDVLRS